MTKSENTPLNKNELEIVRLTVQGRESKKYCKTTWPLPERCMSNSTKTPCKREN